MGRQGIHFLTHKPHLQGGFGTKRVSISGVPGFRVLVLGWLVVFAILLKAVAGIEMGNNSNGGQKRDLTQNHLESPSDPGKTNS